jgi:hypothetical protein
MDCSLVILNWYYTKKYYTYWYYIVHAEKSKPIIRPLTGMDSSIREGRFLDELRSGSEKD